MTKNHFPLNNTNTSLAKQPLCIKLVSGATIYGVITEWVDDKYAIVFCPMEVIGPHLLERWMPTDETSIAISISAIMAIAPLGGKARVTYMTELLYSYSDSEVASNLAENDAERDIAAEARTNSNV